MEKEFEYIYGKNAVKEALAAHRVIALILPEKEVSSPLIPLAKKEGVEVKFLRQSEFAKLPMGKVNQGVVAKVRGYKTVNLKELVDRVAAKANPLLVLLDGIEDPHNLGAILRSADALGADGVVIKDRNASPLNATVAKVSAGAINHIPVASVANMANALRYLKDNGYWTVGTALEGGQPYTELDCDRPLAIVIGNEGKGVSRLVLRECDYRVYIPMKGHVDCLNASVAAGIFMAHISQARDH